MSPKQPAAPDCFGSVRHAACFWSLASEPRAQPALDVEGADGVDLAEFAVQDHLAGLPDERVAGVVVRHARRRRRSSRRPSASSSAWARSNVSGLSQMTLKPASAKVLAISKCVWFGVATETKSIACRRPLRLGVDHLLVGAVGALGRDVVVGRGRLRLGGVAGERPGDEGGAVVEDGGGGVDAADEGPLAAADRGPCGACG